MNKLFLPATFDRVSMRYSQCSQYHRRWWGRLSASGGPPKNSSYSAAAISSVRVGFPLTTVRDPTSFVPDNGEEEWETFPLAPVAPIVWTSLFYSSSAHLPLSIHISIDVQYYSLPCVWMWVDMHLHDNCIYSDILQFLLVVFCIVACFCFIVYFLSDWFIGTVLVTFKVICCCFGVGGYQIIVHMAARRGASIVSTISHFCSAHYLSQNYRTLCNTLVLCTSRRIVFKWPMSSVVVEQQGMESSRDRVFELEIDGWNPSDA